jgi:periplasmic protein TonB
MMRRTRSAASNHVVPRVDFSPASCAVRDNAAGRTSPPPVATTASEPAPAERRRHGRSSTAKPSAFVLSLLAHAAALAAVTLFVTDRLTPPAVPPEMDVALVFAPAPAASAPAAYSASPPADTVQPAPEATAQPEAAPPLEPEPPAPAVSATQRPEPEAEPQPVHDEPPPPPPQKPPSRQPATALARKAPTSPPASHAPLRSAVAEDQQSAAIGSASPATTAALVPPRPVAGMETNRAPVYPESARRRGEEGRVMLRVDVSAEGTPLDVSVAGTSGHASLDSAALSAVRQWRFIPATQAGRSVAAVAEVPVRFHLDN